MIIKVLFRYLWLVIGNSLPNYIVFNKKRYIFYRMAGLSIEDRVVMVGPVSIRIDRTESVIIGRDSYLNSFTRFGCNNDPVKIGAGCQIGPHVSFETVEHDIELNKNKRRGTRTKAIILKDHVWIGAGATILPGVTVGEGAVVAAGAIVNKDVKEYTVVGGVPARLIKGINENNTE